MFASLTALLDQLVDYAGLFPPASESMAEAVRHYAEYRDSPSAWMLGRFIVPASRLGEFAREADPLLAAAGTPWRLSVLLGAEPSSDLAMIAAFNAAHRNALCDAAEVKAASVDDIARVAKAARGQPVTVYVELPVGDDPAILLAAVGAHGLRAKIRTGGTTADAFPTPQHVVRFLAACVRSKIPFKATAGLHHPLRGEYRLTYDRESERGLMYGFLNVFLAAALLRDGGTEEDAAALLTERDAAALTFAPDGVRWGGRLLLTARLAQLRERLAISFGSCSFSEPVNELAALHIT